MYVSSATTYTHLTCTILRACKGCQNYDAKGYQTGFPKAFPTLLPHLRRGDERELESEGEDVACRVEVVARKQSLSTILLNVGEDETTLASRCDSDTYLQAPYQTSLILSDKLNMVYCRSVFSLTKIRDTVGS